MAANSWARGGSELKAVEGTRVPVTTESTCGTASSEHMVAWMPPITTGTPRPRNSAANWAAKVLL